MDERELVKRAQTGDFEAFSELVRPHQGKIFALALRMTANSEDAADIVQETLLKAIDNIEQFRGEASFGTWLYSIGLNQARALLQREKRTDLKPIEEYLPAKSVDAFHDGTRLELFDWKDPHHRLEEQELREAINDAVAALPVNYREAFVLRYIEELPIKDVADLIHESIASTKSRVLRARLAVRDHLARRFEAEYDKKLP